LKNYNFYTSTCALKLLGLAFKSSIQKKRS